MGLETAQSKKIEVVNADEDYLVAQVTRYLKLAKTTAMNEDLKIGWINRAEKVIDIASLIQEENLKL